MKPRAKRFLVICGVLYAVLVTAYLVSVFTKFGYRTIRLPRITTGNVATITFNRDNGLRGRGAPTGSDEFAALQIELETAAADQLIPDRKTRRLPEVFRLKEDALINPAVLAASPVLAKYYALEKSDAGVFHSETLRDAAGPGFLVEDYKVSEKPAWLLQAGACLNDDTITAIALAGFPGESADEPNPEGVPNAEPFSFEVFDASAAVGYGHLKLHPLESVRWVPPDSSTRTEQTLVPAGPQRYLETADVVRFMLAYDTCASLEQRRSSFAGRGLHDVEMRTMRVSGAGNLVGLNLTMVFVSLNFLLLAGLLYGLLWEPITNILDERAARIREDIDTARNRRQDAEKLKGKYATLIDDARDEKNRIIDEGRREGQKERTAIIKKARGEAETIKAAAEEEIEDAVREARKSLQAEFVELAVLAAEKVIERKLNDGDVENTVTDFIAEIEKSAPQDETGGVSGNGMPEVGE